jgi:hypothetical protein
MKLLYTRRGYEKIAGNYAFRAYLIPDQWNADNTDFAGLMRIFSVPYFVRVQRKLFGIGTHIGSMERR